MEGDESKARTPAYSNFDSNTDKVVHLFQFIGTGASGYWHELETKIQPEIRRLIKEIEQIQRPQGKEASDQKTLNSEQRKAVIQKLSDISDARSKPLQRFQGG